jgi:hypothetical protein
MQKWTFSSTLTRAYSPYQSQILAKTTSTKQANLIGMQAAKIRWEANTDTSTTARWKMSSTPPTNTPSKRKPRNILNKTNFNTRKMTNLRKKNDDNKDA